MPKIKKLNSGLGAILCNNCRTIVNTDNFTDEFIKSDNPVFCNKCCNSKGLYPFIYKDIQLYINAKVLVFQNVSVENREKIKQLQGERYDLFNLIKRTDDPILLKIIAGQLTQIEFDLQDAWGFNQIEALHKFWRTPKCICPKLDNEDAYPYVRYMNQNCPLHG